MDVALIIEVADSTLDEDRGLKQRIYAREGIPAYWIVNPPDRVIELYTNPTGPAPKPRYRAVQFVWAEATLVLFVCNQVFGTVTASELLP